MKFRFLHCADLHLGSPMTGLALKDETIAARFAAASRDAFSDLVTCAIEERVAFVLIAGDLYDGDWPDNSIGLFFNREAARLKRADIPVFLVRGNHDADSVVTRTIPLPDNVHAFPTRKAETREIAALRVAIHGRSFADRAAPENYVPAFPRAKPGWFNIGLLHTSCEGRPPHATYAPCSVADLVSRGYDYWALGHVHAYEALNRDPWIVFSGNLQGRNVRETGEKGAVLVEVEDARVTSVRRLILDRARWVAATVDVSGLDAMPDVLSAIREELRRSLGEAGSRLVAARVRVTGATALDPDLRAARSQLADDALALAQHIHADAWIEKLVVDTRPPAALSPCFDLSAFDLAGLLSACAADPAWRERAREAIGRIAPKLPGEPQDDADGLDLDALIEDARALALVRSDEGRA